MTAMSTAETRTGTTQSRRARGESGIWIFAILDMLIFAEMFGIYGWYRAEHHDAFHAAQDQVIPVFGLAYTVILLASSWFVVLAVSAARTQQLELADKLVKVGLALGTSFAIIKVIEYSFKIAAGITPVTNDFFMFFFVMTFVHLLHASAGLGVLIYMRRRIRTLPAGYGTGDTKEMRVVETCGIYWHMVDLLWLVLFALFYLRG